MAPYLAGKAKKEIEAGSPAAPNAATFIRLARVLAIVGIVVAALFHIGYMVFGVLVVLLD